MMETKLALKAKFITKYFYSPEIFQVIKDISFTISTGEFISIVGKSGCGKSTLLYILSTLDTDYDGELIINSTNVTGKSQTELAIFRSMNLGFVFQFHYLLPDFTCLKNVMIPGLRLDKHTHDEVEHQAYEKLKVLGVADQAMKPASRISGGQQQRVAIARALINDPAIIMCDEPTGNLDSKNAANVFDMFMRLSRDLGHTIITVTHDNDFANKSDRLIEMLDGKIVNKSNL